MLTAQELARLMELSSKGITNLNDAEKAELTQLQAKAIGTKTEGKEMTEADLKAAVESAVKSATAGTVKTEDVQKIVDAAIKSIPTAKELDQKSLADAVAAAVKPGITVEDVKGIVNEGLKNIRTGSKMVHPENDGAEEYTRFEIPHGDRKGNLPVWKKQLLNALVGKSMNAGISDDVVADVEKRSARAEKSLIESYSTKGITTTGVGTGKEWMAVGFSTQLLQAFYMESQLAQALLASEVDMPTDPYTYPLDGARPEFSLGAEEEDISETGFETGDLVLKTAKLVGKVPYSYEAEEDALIPILPQILKQLGEAGAMDYEDVVINGDTTGTQDVGIGAKSRLRAWDGLRKLALAQAALKKDLSTGGVSVTNVGILKKALKKYGLNPKNVFILAGVNAYNDFTMLPETLTAEKVGNAASARVLTGMAPNLLGMDIIPSAAMREDLNGSGTYDNNVTSKGAFMLVWRPGFISGVRRGFTIETDVNKHMQKKWVIASFRRTFKPIRSLAKVQAASIGYNFNSGN